MNHNIILALPEVTLLILIGGIMMVDLFSAPEKRADRLMGLAVITLLIVGAAVYNPFVEARFAFNGMFVVDGMAAVLKVAMAACLLIGLLYSRDHLEKRGLFTGEYVMLMLFALLGMMVMVSANNFVTLYLGLEIQALSVYALVALQRDSARASEAAMKYFILGALASGLLLYGISMVYGATGSLDIEQVAKSVGFSQGNTALLAFGLVFVVAGLAFKLGVVPFHMWVPDVYHGAATPTTMLLSTAPKIAAFAFIVRILGDGLAGMAGDWQLMLVFLAVLSLAIGNIVAIAQTNLKRMLAYSTISHMGFLVLGILAGTNNGYSSSMFYVVTYALTALASFGMILLLSREGFEAENLEDFKGLNQRSPWHAFLMLIVMFSLAGIPPTVGFFAKLSVLQAALEAGWVWLVVFAVLMSVIGAFYYLRVVKLMYMDAPVDTAPIGGNAVAGSLLTVNTFALLLLGLLPSGLLELCRRAIAASF
ncbi:MAG: NADH-quinone oxidoreductase subunit NuoN [Betaproteobacteria bacterium]|nr:NADH-quinone oxidoreductase subunit NuoN [Betaproteobacteria bacterium]